jgi:hypothetical protein
MMPQRQNFTTGNNGKAHAVERTMAEAGPERFTVRILGADGRVRGLGVLVGEFHIVTCAHVVNSVLGREQRAQPQPEPDVRVLVDFPFLDDHSRPLPSTVVVWLPPSDSRGMGDDVAGLVITESPPHGAVAARLAYYLETGRGMKLDRVADAIAAMETLSAFLDDVTDGGESVRSRLAAEGISSL